MWSLRHLLDSDGREYQERGWSFDRRRESGGCQTVIRMWEGTLSERVEYRLSCPRAQSGGWKEVELEAFYDQFRGAEWTDEEVFLYDLFLKSKGCHCHWTYYSGVYGYNWPMFVTFCKITYHVFRSVKVYLQIHSANLITVFQCKAEISVPRN